MLFRVASAPSYTTLQAGVDPAKTGKITAALDQAGVSYKLENNGTAIAVVSGQESKARVALAGQGLAAGGSQPGYELLDKQKLGSSTFQQQIAYQRALEGQIAQTIGQIDGISGAQVQLTLPKDDLFADEKQPATAAVLLNADSTALDPAAIRGIASLVSSSVPNLKPSNVTITDASGSMLWPQGDGGDARRHGLQAGGRGPLREPPCRATLGALIARTVGPDKAQVQVHADLNVDKATQEQLAVRQEGHAAGDDQGDREPEGHGQRRAAAPPARPPTCRPTRRTRRRRAATPTTSAPPARPTFGVDKTVTRKTDRARRRQQARRRAARRQVGPGGPGHRSSRRPWPPPPGINPKRGDTMTQSTVVFAKPKAAPGPAGLPVPPAFVAPLKYAGIGLASILFLFFMTRALRRRETEALPMPTWLTEIEGPRPLAELEQHDEPRPRRWPPSAPAPRRGRALDGRQPRAGAA